MTSFVAEEVTTGRFSIKSQEDENMEKGFAVKEEM